MRNYLRSQREGGRLVRCPCGNEFIDHTGREFCSRACAEPIELFRVCRDCGGVKPLTEEFFRLVRGRWSDRKWFRRVCNDCMGVYTQRHEDQAQEQDPEGRSYAQQKYAKRPEIYKEKRRRREALKRTTQVERVDLEALLAEHGRSCHICGWEIADGARMHWDHIVPLSRGGTHTADNLAPSHGPCNDWKGARLMGELDLEARSAFMARKLAAAA